MLSTLFERKKPNPENGKFYGTKDFNFEMTMKTQERRNIRALKKT